MNIYLASKSETRGKLLKNAKISFSRIDHSVDEDEVKISLQNQPPTEIAIKLSELKATQPNPENKEDLVIGSGQRYSLKSFVYEVFKLLKIPKNCLKASTKKLMRKKDIKSYRSDPRLAKKVLKWKTKVTFEQIIYKMVNEQLY